MAKLKSCYSNVTSLVSHPGSILLTVLEFGANSSFNGSAARRMTEFRSQPFGDPFGPMLKRAGSSIPSTPGPLSGFGFDAVNGTSTPSAVGFNLGTEPASDFLGQHVGGPGSGSCFGTSGSFASGASLNCAPPIPPPIIAGPSSFPLEVPFGAGAHQSDTNQSDTTQSNRSHSGSFNPNQFYQSDSTLSNSNSLNQSNPTSFNQSNPTSFNQSTPNQFNQSTPSQFNPLATSSPFSTPVPNMSSASSKSPSFNIGAAPPVQQNRFGRPVKKFPRRNRKGKDRAISKDDPIIIDQDLDIIEEEFAMMEEDP